MDSATPAVNGFTPDARTLPRSPYAKRLLSLAVGDSFRVAISRRALVAVLATRWGRATGRRFVTRKIGKRCLIERVT